MKLKVKKVRSIKGNDLTIERTLNVFGGFRYMLYSHASPRHCDIEVV